MSDLPFSLPGSLSQSWTYPLILPGAVFSPISESDMPTFLGASAFSESDFCLPSACLISATTFCSKVFSNLSLISLF